jgi:tripartite-type tricarboxylate transporter receptor subunit TctC
MKAEHVAVKKSTRTFAATLLGTAFVLAFFGGTAAYPQGYPLKPQKFIVPTPAGSSVDIAARLIAEGLRERLGQPVVVENKAGAGGTIAAAEVARAAPDGYTLFAGFNGPLATAPFLFTRLTYKPLESFAPVVATVSQPHVLVVNVSHPARTLAEFVADVRMKSGQYNYASVGNASASHLTMELFKMQAGLAISHIPYNGGPAATQALIAGDVQALFVAYANVKELVVAGRLKVLGLAENSRSPALSNVPTFTEQGVRGVDAPLFNAIVAPAGTPKNIVDLLNREIRAVLDAPEVRSRLAGAGMDVIGGSPDQLTALMRSEAQKWEPIIRRLGLKLD